MNGSVEKIWEQTDLADQKEVNKAMKDTMMIVSPAIEKVWQVNLKVNVLYGVLAFCAIASGIIIGLIQIFKGSGKN